MNFDHDSISPACARSERLNARSSYVKLSYRLCDLSDV